MGDLLKKTTSQEDTERLEFTSLPKTVLFLKFQGVGSFFTFLARYICFRVNHIPPETEVLWCSLCNLVYHKTS